MGRGGTITVDASGVVNTSGKPQRVYGLTITSNATAGGIVTLRNGTGATDTIFMTPQGKISDTTLITGFPAEGMYFPAGLYVSIGTNVTVAYIQVEQVSTT